MRKRKTMDIGGSLENTGIISLQRVHPTGRKSGQIDHRRVHFLPELLHDRKSDKAGPTTMLERVKPSRVKDLRCREFHPLLTRSAVSQNHDRI
jgi:hypothetical protein